MPKKKADKGGEMNFNDKGSFSEKMMEMARVMGPIIDDSDVDAYFNQLDEYPIEIVVRAIDVAIHIRDPEDKFLEKTLITLPEILGAIKKITKPPEGKVGTVASCRICEGMGWIATAKDEKGRFIAWPCECLYNSAKESLASKQRPTASAEVSRRCCKNIVVAYEYHQKKWGTGFEPKVKE